MIKSVRVEPIAIYDGSFAQANVLIEIDAADLYDLYVEKGINPEYVNVTYVVVNDDDAYDLEKINLKEAVDTGHEVSNFALIQFGYVHEGN